MKKIRIYVEPKGKPTIGYLCINEHKKYSWWYEGKYTFVDETVVGPSLEPDNFIFDRRYGKRILRHITTIEQFNKWFIKTYGFENLL